MDFEEKHFNRVQAFQATIIALVVLGITANFWGFKIYAFGWHLFNANPYVWESLKISVPDEMVVKKVKNDQNREIINLINYSRGSQVSIYFAQLNESAEDDPLKAIYKKMKFDLIADKPCTVFNQSCQWIIGKYKEEEEEKYREDIFLNSHNIYISFQGPKDKRSFLDQIVSSLQKA